MRAHKPCSASVERGGKKKRVTPKSVQMLIVFLYLGEQKTDKGKSHKGIWWWECPGSVPGINSARPRDTRDVWADLRRNSHSRGRTSAGQTGQMTGQMGHVHGTDGTQTKGRPAKILYVYWFFSFPIYQKNPRVRKIRVRNSGARNGCANFMGAWKKCVLSAGNLCP